MNRTSLACTAMASLAALGVSAIVTAGPLDPPAGPVTPSYKTLTEVEPRIAINATNTPGDADSLFKITQPGSYYLTANVTGVTGKHGIEIASSGVSIDLMGFTLGGVPGSLSGVSGGGLATSEVRLTGGVVQGWGGLGVELLQCDGASLLGVHAIGNAGIGILCGERAIVESCTAASNGSDGIVCAAGSVVLGCAARENAGSGIAINAGSVARSCEASANGFSGVTAVASVVENCAASYNTAHGFAVSSCTLLGCTAAFNLRDGIEASGACRIAENSCRSNGVGAADGAGIRLIGADNAVEANNCTSNDAGIRADVPANIIIRNACSGNTINWVIVAGNAYGPIVATPAGAAVSGNTASAALGSTEPNANFTY